MKIERFEDIEGWKLARELTRMVYLATKQAEFSKDYGLKDQIQRAAGSAMHNIAEGFHGEVTQNSSGFCVVRNVPVPKSKVSSTQHSIRNTSPKKNSTGFMTRPP